MKLKTYISPLIAASLLLTGCSEKPIPSGGDGYGTVSFGLGGADAVLVSGTKAAVAEEVLADFTVSVPGAEIKEKYSTVNGKMCPLPAGNYIASAYYPVETAEEAKNENGGYGVMHYYGESDAFEVVSGSHNDVKIDCTVDNASISIAYSDTFRKIFDIAAGTTVTLAEDTGFTVRALEMREGITAWFSAGDNISIKVVAQKINEDESRTFTFENKIAAVARHAYTVTLDAKESEEGEEGGITFKIAGQDIVTGDFLSLESYTCATVTEDQ